MKTVLWLLTICTTIYLANSISQFSTGLKDVSVQLPAILASVNSTLAQIKQSIADVKDIQNKMPDTAHDTTQKAIGGVTDGVKDTVVTVANPLNTSPAYNQRVCVTLVESSGQDLRRPLIFPALVTAGAAAD